MSLHVWESREPVYRYVCRHCGQEHYVSRQVMENWGRKRVEAALPYTGCPRLPGGDAAGRGGTAGWGGGVVNDIIYVPRPIRMEGDTRVAIERAAPRSPSIRVLLNHIAYLDQQLEGIQHLVYEEYIQQKGRLAIPGLAHVAGLRAEELERRRKAAWEETAGALRLPSGDGKLGAEEGGSGAALHRLPRPGRPRS